MEEVEGFVRSGSHLDHELSEGRHVDESDLLAAGPVLRLDFVEPRWSEEGARWRVAVLELVCNIQER